MSVRPSSLRRSVKHPVGSLDQTSERIGAVAPNKSVQRRQLSLQGHLENSAVTIDRPRIRCPVKYSSEALDQGGARASAIGTEEAVQGR
jgi:hypothetical protein